MKLGGGKVNKKSKEEKKLNPNDFHPTPPEAVRALIFNEKIFCSIWDPACGSGTVKKVFTEYDPYSWCIASDLREEIEFFPGLVHRGLNFLSDDCNYLVGKYAIKTIVSNPPYSFVNEFIRKALSLPVVKICFLLRIAALESIDRYHIFRGSPLKRVLVFSDRLRHYNHKMQEWRRDGQFGHAWFIWDKSYEGKPTIEFILARNYGNQDFKD